MFDAPFRQFLAHRLAAPARALARAGVSPNVLSIGGCALAGVAAVLVARGVVVVGMAVWLLSRLTDGLDGLVAREAGQSSSFGGYLDITLDMAAYSAMLLGFAVLHPEGGWVWYAILVGYLLVTTTTLALSSILEREQATIANENRSLQFTPGFAEAGETTIAYLLFALLPSQVTIVGWIWAGVCGATVVQRTVLARRLLRGGGRSSTGTRS